MRELERQLLERDKVILELLERVEALERRVGVKREISEPGQAEDEEQNSSNPGTNVSAKAEKSEDVPGMVKVEQGETERALERSLTRVGALLLPNGVLEVEPGLRYGRSEDSSPRLFQLNSQLFVSETESNVDRLTADVAFRLGLPWDAQLEIGLPYQWLNVERVSTVDFAPVGQSSQSGDGFGDIRVGFAKTLLREGLWQPDLVGRLTWDTKSGERFDDDVSLGGGFNELRGSLTAIKRQDPIVLVGGLSYEYSFEEDDFQPGSIIAATLGSYVALSPETSLSFVFAGAYQDESEFFDEAIAGSDRVIASFGVGGSTLLAPGLLMNVSVDFGLTDDADDFAVSLSFPFRMSEPLY